MPDKEETKVETQIQEEVTKIKVGEAEYDQAELDHLIGLGKSAEELESKWNTKIDRLMPEYTKTTQELKALREEKEEQARLEAERNKPQEEVDWEQTRKQAREEAKKLGLVLDEDLETYYQQRKQGDKSNDRRHDGLLRQAGHEDAQCREACYQQPQPNQVGGKVSEIQFRPQVKRGHHGADNGNHQGEKAHQTDKLAKHDFR